MKRFLKNFIKNPLNMINLIIICALIFVSFFPSVIAPYDPLEMDSRSILEPPSFTHFLELINLVEMFFLGVFMEYKIV